MLLAYHDVHSDIVAAGGDVGDKLERETHAYLVGVAEQLEHAVVISPATAEPTAVGSEGQSWHYGHADMVIAGEGIAVGLHDVERALTHGLKAGIAAQLHSLAACDHWQEYLLALTEQAADEPGSADLASDRIVEQQGMSRHYLRQRQDAFGYALRKQAHLLMAMALLERADLFSQYIFLSHRHIINTVSRR